MTTLVHTIPWNQVLSRSKSFDFLDAPATRLTVPSSDWIQPMESQDWRSQTLSALIAQVKRARGDFYSPYGFWNHDVYASIFRKTRLYGPSGRQWPADSHKEDYVKRRSTSFAAKLEVTLNFLTCLPSITSLQLSRPDFHCNRKLRPDEVHGILEEFLRFFRHIITNR